MLLLGSCQGRTLIFLMLFPMQTLMNVRFQDPTISHGSRKHIIYLAEKLRTKVIFVNIFRNVKIKSKHPLSQVSVAIQLSLPQNAMLFWIVFIDSIDISLVGCQQIFKNYHKYMQLTHNFLTKFYLKVGRYICLSYIYVRIQLHSAIFVFQILYK